MEQIFYSEMFFSSLISDSALTKKSGVLDRPEQKHELYSDRKFFGQEHFAAKGVFLNLPAQNRS